MNSPDYIDSNEFEAILSIEQIIFGLHDGNVADSAKSIIDKFDKNYPISFNLILSQIIYSRFVMKKKDYKICLNFLKEVESLEEKIKSTSKIFVVFRDFLHFQEDTKESNDLLEKLNNKTNFMKPNKTLYEARYITPEELEESNRILDSCFVVRVKLNKDGFIGQELNEGNDFNHEDDPKNGEKHKEIIEEEATKAIRKDDDENLLEILSEENFDFNQEITPSLHEKYSFFTRYGGTLIDYSAFFGSIKCFKYLLMNGANVKNTGKYAIAGGNEEIIHLCEQNHSSFEDAYETAIKYHKNDIFKYIYENKFEEISDIEKLGILCIRYYNHEILSFLLEKGMKINDNIINESAKIGNLFLVKYFLRNYHIPNEILIFSSESGNIELVKYVLKRNDVNINAKDFHLF